jgi:hypothetical protein
MSNEDMKKENIVSFDKNEYPTIAKSITRMKEVADRNKQREEVDKHLDSKDYLITQVVSPDVIMSSGDSERQISPKKTYKIVSLIELPTYIVGMNKSIWEHPDLKEDLSNAEDIPFEEKKWGIKSHLTIQPFSEELEKQYLKTSKGDWFKTWREVQVESGDFINKRTDAQDSFGAESESA